MRPTIGITSDFNPGDDNTEPTCFLRSRYINMIEGCGGIPMILPLAKSDEVISSILDKIDGLMLTGSGPDIDPSLYGEERRFDFKVMSQERASFEIRITRMAMERGMPIIGICGGMQMLNVAAGGSLYQDIGSELSGSLRHRQEGAPHLPAHTVNIREDTLLFKIINSTQVMVNSFHHQCAKRVAPGLIVNAASPDGIIEGIESGKKDFVIGLQWHPEYLFKNDTTNRMIIEAFLDRCQRN